MCGVFLQTFTWYQSHFGLASIDPPCFNGCRKHLLHSSPFQHHDSHGDHQTLLLQLSPMEEPASSSPWKPRTSRPCGWNSCTSSTVCSCWLSNAKHQALGVEKNLPVLLESFALLLHGGSHGRGCGPLHLTQGLVSTRKYIQSPIKIQRNSA